MTITRYHIAEKYSEIVIHGDTIYLCGQLADDLTQDMAGQTRETLAHIDRLLAEVGSDKSKLLSATVYVKNMAEVGAMNVVWIDWLKGHQPPARTCVQAQMVDPAILVEITVVAAK